MFDISDLFDVDVDALGTSTIDSLDVTESDLVIDVELSDTFALAFSWATTGPIPPPVILISTQIARATEAITRVILDSTIVCSSFSWVELDVGAIPNPTTMGDCCDYQQGNQYP